MTRTVLQFILKFIILIPAQSLIFNNLVLFDVAVPFVFIYLIISMPITWSTNATLLIGFITGLTIDIFSDTLGMNTLACTLLTFAQKPIFHLYMQRDEDLGGLKPSVKSMGSTEYMKYLITMVVAFCCCIFLIDAFAVFSFTHLILCVLCSSAFTFIIIYALDSITTARNEKRL